MNRTIKILGFFVVIFIVLISSQIELYSVIYTSSTSGSWSDNNTWGGGGHPQAGDIAIIQSAHTVTVMSNVSCSSASITGNLTINNGFTLSTSSTITQISGAFTINGSVSCGDNIKQTGGSITINAGGTLTCNDLTVSSFTLANTGNLTCDNFISSGTSNLSGNFTLNAGGNFTLKGGTTTLSTAITVPGNLTTQNTSTLNINSALTLTGALNIQNTSSVTVSANSSCGSIAENGNLTISNGITLTNGGAINQTGGTISVSGVLANTGNYSQTAGTLNIASTGSFSAANISTASTVSISGALTNNGSYTQSAGSISVNGALTSTGDFTQSGGTLTIVSGKSLSCVNISTASTVNINGTLTLTGNYTITNGTTTLGNSLSIPGNLVLTAGTFDLSTNTLTLNGNVSYTAGKINASNSNSTLIIGATGPATINPNWFSSQPIGNLTLNRSSSLSGDLNIGGTLSFSGGTLDISGAIILTLNKDVGSGGHITTNSSSSLVLQGATAWNSTRILTGITTLNNLTINLTNASNSIATSANLTIAGTLTLSNGTLDISGDQLTLSNDVSAGGHITTNSSSSLVLQGATAWNSTRILTGITVLNNLTINLTNASNTIATSANLAIYGTLTVTNGTLDISGDQLTLYNDVGVAGKITTNSSSSLVLTGSTAWSTTNVLTNISNLNNLTISLSHATNSVINQVQSPMTISGNISISSGTFYIGNNTINIAGNLALSGSGSFKSSSNPCTAVVNFNGTSAISNSGSGEIIFGELQVANTKTATLSTSVEVRNDITIGTNSTLTASSGTLTLNGSGAITLTNSGTCELNDMTIASTSAGATIASGFQLDGDLLVNNTFTATSGTITFGGSSQQKISGSTEPTFYHLTLNNSAGIILYQNIKFSAAAQSILKLTSGDIDLNGPYIITFQNSTDKLSETSGNNIVNNGSSATGYLTTTSGISTSNLSTSNIGLTLTGPSNLTVRLYPKTACNDGIPSVKRYFKITCTGSISAMSLTYDDTELYGNANELAVYSSGNLSDWEKHTSTISGNTVSATNSISLDNPTYFALFTDAKFFANNLGNGLWSAKENWKDSLKPDENDVVVIGEYTVYLDEDVTLTDLVLSKSTTHLKPLSNGTYNMTVKGNFTCGGTNCSEPSSEKFVGTNGDGRINLIFDNSTQKTISTYQDGEIIFYNVKITDNSSIVSSGNYRIDVTGDFVVEGDGSFIPASGTTINFKGAMHPSVNKHKSKRNKSQTDFVATSGEQTIINSTDGTLEFSKVSIGDGAKVTTSSDFTVTSQFQVLGTGSFIATAGTITFNGSPVTISNSSQGTLKFYKIVNSNSISTNTSFYIIDDFVTNGNFTQTDGNITFDNDGSYLYPKRIYNNNNSTVIFANLIIKDGSYVTTTDNFIIADDQTNKIEVEGSGYFKATGGTIILGSAGLTGTTQIINSNNGTLEFNDLTIANVSKNVTSGSGFIILGDFTVNSSATFSGSSSSIKFKNGSSSGAIQNITGSSQYKTFGTLIIDDATNVETSTSFTIEGDLKILGNGSLTASIPSYIIFDGGNAKSIDNKGTLEFYNLTLASASSGTNLVTTNSDFTVKNYLTTQGTSSNGSLLASGNSTITLGSSGAVTNPLTNNTTTGNSLEFQNLKIPSGVTQNISSSFRIKGDLINNGSFTATAGKIYFVGTEKQKIQGNTAPTFYSLYLNNPYGIKLENSFSFANGGAGVLTLSNGDIDLNGDNTITMSSTSATLSESAGNSIINSKRSKGGNNGGYITTAQIASANLVDNSGIGIDITGSGATNITVRRYQNSLDINDYQSIKRYFKLSYTNTITSATMTFDNSDLPEDINANTLSLYSASSESSSSWTSHSGTYTSGSIYGNSGYGYVAKTSLSGLSSGNFLTASPKSITIRTLPITGINENNKFADSPLIAGTTDKLIFGFSILSTDNIDYLTNLTIDFGNNLSAVLSNFKLYYDTDNDLKTYGRTLASGSISTDGNQVKIINMTESLTANTRKYYFIYADVSSQVNSSTSSIAAKLTDDDITITKTKVPSFTINGKNYSFSALNVSVDNKNAPSSDALGKLGQNADQVIYGFRLTPVDNAPSSDFSSVNISIEIAGGSNSTEFTNFKLWKDNNKNGIKDGGDSNLGTTFSLLPSSNKLNFNGLGQSISEETNYILTCQVSDTAKTDGKIKAKIQSNADISLSSPASISTSAPYSGRFMIVKESNSPTKLLIKNISLASPVSGMGSKEIISGRNVTITIEAQDSKGTAQKISETTNIQLSIIGGVGTLTSNSSQNMTINKSQVTWNNLVITNNDGESDLTILAKAVSGMTSLEADTMSSIIIYREEPTSSPSSLTITEVKPTSLSLSWTAGNPEKYLLLVKKSSEPTAPSKGVDYEAVRANNISYASDNLNYTADGSIVVYKGGNTSITVQGLEANTHYYFAVYNYNGEGNSIRYRTTANSGDYVNIADTTTFASEPTENSSGLNFTNVKSNQMTLSFTKGNGSNRIVICRNGSRVSDYPSDGRTYTASSEYGNFSSRLGDAYVVYNGDGNTVTITNLNDNTTYYFAVFEYNGSGYSSNYFSVTEDAYRKTLYAEPSIQASNISFTPTEDPSVESYSNDSQIKVNWVNGSGTGRIVLAKIGSPIVQSDYPKDGICSVESVTSSPIRLSENQFADAFVIYNGTGSINSATVTGLSFGNTYYFRVFEYNGDGTTISNSSNVNYLIDEATDNPNSKTADRYENNDDRNNLDIWKYVKTDFTIYKGSINSATDEDWYYVYPDFENNKNNLRIYLTGLPEDYSIDLYNSSGRLIRRSHNSGLNDENITINNLPNDKYFIRVYSATGDFSSKAYTLRAKGNSIIFYSNSE